MSFENRVAYYNEIDEYCCQWLENLIAAGHLPAGYVDNRPVQEVRADDLEGYTECHFFAGIGVWAYALSLGGFDELRNHELSGIGIDRRQLWTGSCPCQPFSVAGKKAGKKDERHLWPVWQELIRACRPQILFGEQVASKDTIGRIGDENVRGSGSVWIDDVFADMEAAQYACGAFDFPTAGIGAPHIRQRLWFVAEDGLAQSTDERLERRQGQRKNNGKELAPAERDCHVGGLGNPESVRRLGRQDEQDFGRGQRALRQASTLSSSQPGPTNNHWQSADWLRCTDNLWRPVEPGTFPLANGASSRVGRLRAYGNAISPQVAAEVIKAYFLYKLES